MAMFICVSVALKVIFLVLLLVLQSPKSKEE